MSQSFREGKVEVWKITVSSNKQKRTQISSINDVTSDSQQLLGHLYIT